MTSKKRGRRCGNKTLQNPDGMPGGGSRDTKYRVGQKKTDGAKNRGRQGGGTGRVGVKGERKGHNTREEKNLKKTQERVGREERQS